MGIAELLWALPTRADLKALTVELTMAIQRESQAVGGRLDALESRVEAGEITSKSLEPSITGIEGQRVGVEAQLLELRS